MRSPFQGFVAALCLTCCLQSLANAAGPDPILLWPDGAPGAKGTEDVDKPEIRIYPATDNPTGAMVVVCPGGGYGALATDHEGHQIAKWFNRMGVSAVVVKYRLGPRYQHPAPLQDAQRAVRYVRANAKDLKIDPNRVGIMGFSAGGHLASSVSTHFDSGDKSSDDVVAQQSSRPDFSILCYPVITMGEFTHKGSRRNLLGPEPTEDMIELMSNEKQVTAETPPTFIFHTANDRAVPIQNALAYYEALMKHGVKAELHVYQNGPHGVGLAPGDAVLGTWPERLADWLKLNNFLKPVEMGNVSGQINHENEPLRWGTLAFIPQDELILETCVMVSRGRFRADVPVGQHSLRIVDLGDVVPYPTAEDASTLSESTIQFNVVAGDNELALDLQ